MEIEEKDYYAILKVPREATKDEIKKAYKKLAVVHHPDKSGEDTVFKDISEAYSVLSDDEKKEIYDQYGVAGVKEYENSPLRNARVKLQPLFVEVVCNLAELYNGTQKQMTVRRMIIEGNLKAPQTLKKTPEEEEFVVDIEPFTLYGQKFVHQGKGHRHQTEDIVGDLIFIVVPKSQEVDENNQEISGQDNNEDYKGYTLEGLDLHYKLTISLSEALLGFKQPIEFLDGTVGLISSSKIVKPGTVKILHERGFKKDIRLPIGIMHRKGDLHIHFDVQFPDKLTTKQAKHLVAALGSPQFDQFNEKDISAELKFKLDELKDPEPEQQDGAQTIFINSGMMPGMPGMMPGMPGMMPGMPGMPQMSPNGQPQECVVM